MALRGKKKMIAAAAVCVSTGFSFSAASKYLDSDMVSLVLAIFFLGVSQFLNSFGQFFVAT